MQNRIIDVDSLTAAQIEDVQLIADLFATQNGGLKLTVDLLPDVFATTGRVNALVGSLINLNEIAEIDAAELAAELATV